jgi:hypothetical protein
MSKLPHSHQEIPDAVSLKAISNALYTKLSNASWRRIQQQRHAEKSVDAQSHDLLSRQAIHIQWPSL